MPYLAVSCYEFASVSVGGVGVLGVIVGGFAYAVRDVGVGVVGIGIGDYLRVEECLRTAWVMLPTR